MRIEIEASYAEEDDYAYIYLGRKGGSAFQHMLDEPNAAGTVIFDFDRDGRITGIEVLGASKVLPRELLQELARK